MNCDIRPDLTGADLRELNLTGANLFGAEIGWTAARGVHTRQDAPGQRERPSTLTRAIGPLGRIPKMFDMLAYANDERHRRHPLTQLD